MIPLVLLDVAIPQKTTFALRGIFIVGGIVAVVALCTVAIVLILLTRKKKK